MAQLTMFDEPAPPPVINPKRLARRESPETSKQAAEEIAPKLAGVQIAVLAAVEDWPGSTARELAKHIGWETGAVNKRLPELEEAGQVVRGEPRRCSESGKNAATWTAKVKRGSRI